MAAREDAPPPPAVRPGTPRATVLTLAAGFAREDVTGLCARALALVRRRDAQVLVCDVRALVDPDACVVDVLARLQLTVRRAGCELQLRHASSGLLELLDLVGLTDVLSSCTDLADRNGDGTSPPVTSPGRSDPAAR